MAQSLKRTLKDVTMNGDAVICENGKVPSNSVALRISFVEQEDSFIKYKWAIVNDELNKISSSWEFVAFGIDHKSAIVSLGNPDSIEELHALKSIIINNEAHQIVIQELRSINKRAIIYNKFLIPLSDQEILSDLTSQGIDQIFRISKSNDLGERFYTGSVIITFKLSSIPSTVVINNVKIPVKQLDPRPMLCAHCGLLGHTKSRCKKSTFPNCSKCFHCHLSTETCIKICKNCKGDHFSDDKNCDQIKQEIKILKIKENHNINYFDAKVIAGNSGDCDLREENERDKITEKLKQQIVDYNKVCEELQIERQEKEKALQDLDTAINQVQQLTETTIPEMEKRFLDYKIKNDQDVKSLQEMLQSSVKKANEDVVNLNKQNLSGIKRCKELKIKLRDHTDFYEKFTKVNPMVAASFAEYTRTNLNHPFNKKKVVSSENLNIEIDDP